MPSENYIDPIELTSKSRALRLDLARLIELSKWHQHMSRQRILEARIAVGQLSETMRAIHTDA